MVVYTEVPTRGLSSTDASRYAQFLKFAAADGQSPGTATGQLPPGYLPMTPANGLGTLAAYTRTAADAVAAQSGKVPPIVPGATPSTSPTPSTSVLGGNATKSSSPTSTASTSPDGSSPLGGGGTAIGPILRSGSATSRSGGSAKAPVSAPEAATKGALAAIGKTAAIISHLAGSIVWWLVSIAAGALAGAGAFYIVARRRGVKLGLRGLIAAIKEWLSSVVARRRAPR